MDINRDSVIGLACATSFFRCGFSNDTRIGEFMEDSDRDHVVGNAQWFLEGTGIRDHKVTLQDVCESVWGEVEYAEWLEEQEAA